MAASSSRSRDSLSASEEPPHHDASQARYTLVLTRRSDDPARDAASLPREQLPSHHVPTIVARASVQSDSLLRRAARTINPAHGGSQADAASIADTAGKRKPQRVRSVVRSAVASVKPGDEAKTHDYLNDGALAALTFANPWDSFRKPSVHDMINGGLKWGLPRGYEEGQGKGKYRGKGNASDRRRQELDKVLRDIAVRKPDWGESPGQSQPASDSQGVRVTWLGHATTLISFPPLGSAPDGSRRSFNVLIDPVFSERCSPSQTAGPIRFTPAPCSVDDLPPIDCCLISHSHYDHQDYNSLRDLLRTRGAALNVLVPLGNKLWFTEAGFADDQVSELDWWDEAAIEFGGASRLRIVCTPAQHGSGRGAGDKDATLWSSWLLERVASADERYRVFFAGDTGLRFKNENRKPRSAYPACPAFREISIRYGVPHLLLLPISVGSSLSYFRSWDPLPRRYSPFPRVESPLTSAIHMDGQDSVDCARIMRLEGETDEAAVKARRLGPKNGITALAVHYGTFVRNEKQTREDLHMLFNACEHDGMRFIRTEDGRFDATASPDDKGRFLVADQGETVLLPLDS